MMDSMCYIYTTKIYILKEGDNPIIYGLSLYVGLATTS
jgi:hypothetical protein